MEEKTKEKIVVSIFFIIFLIIGLCIYSDYGLSWDEPKQREFGTWTFNYIFHKNSTLLPAEERYYGTIFELSLVIAEKAFKLTDIQDIYLMRHLFNFLIFYIGVFFFYLLCKNYFKNWKIGLLGSLFLVLSPRIFADSFYNSKDIVFLSLFIISIYTLLKFLEKKNYTRVGLHAITCALVIDVRILGIIVPFITLFFIILDILKEVYYKNKNETKKISYYFGVYILFLIVIIVIFWPILWKNPIYNFIQAFKTMANYPWSGEMLYFGEYVSAANLPWHYIPVWISITTPILYLLGFIFGILTAIYLIIKSKLNIYDEDIRNNIIVISWFFLPPIAVIVLHSVLYDAWRQMFFIYPAFLIMALQGVISFFYFIDSLGRFKKILKMALIVGVIICLLSTFIFMIKSHPNENVYFNLLAGKSENIKNNFEMDYWGLSYRQGLEYILNNDNRTEIKIVVENLPGFFNSYLLKKQDRERLKYMTRLNDTDYFLTNYRWHSQDYNYPEFYSLKINNFKIMSIYTPNNKL